MSNVTYAVKIIENYEENIEDILQEYKILFEHSLHPNIPLLAGAYRRVMDRSRYMVNFSHNVQS